MKGTKLKKSIAFLWLCTFLLYTGVSFAGKATGIELAKGTKLSVRVPDLDEEDEAAGLTKEWIQTLVEIRLRNNGLTIVDFEDPTSLEFFNVDVGVLPVDIGGVIKGYSITWNIALWRAVSYTVKAKKYSAYVASDYRVGHIICGTKSQVAEIIRGRMMEDLDDFSNEILKNMK